jgi:hypothetical protein
MRFFDQGGNDTLEDFYVSFFPFLLHKLNISACMLKFFTKMFSVNERSSVRDAEVFILQAFL